MRRRARPLGWLSRARVRAALALGAIGGVALAVACGGVGFDPQSKVEGVRMFGVKVDKPYARPGDTVTLEVLLTDGRRRKPRPLKLFWIPVACLNPRDDLYYLCFAPGAGSDAGVRGSAGTRFFPIGPAAAAAADAGVEAGAGPGRGGGGGPLATIPTGIDLGPFLPQGSTISFRVPDDAIQPRVGTDPYGLSIVFNIACAGQVRLAEPDPGGRLQQVPIQCTDESGVPLPPEDYVIGISRVYAYETRTNTNPVIEKVTFQGADVDLTQGITVDRCTAVTRTECPEVELDIRVSDASWEPNPGDIAAGEALREQIWVSYYSDKGDVDVDARLLFDTTRGRPETTAVKFRGSPEPGRGSVWAVVHDNRGGTAWVVIPVTVR